MTPEERAVHRVLRAVQNPGQAPGVHQHQIERLAVEWRPLARALAAFMEAHGAVAPKEWK
jgi:hypothetical protein